MTPAPGSVLWAPTLLLSIGCSLGLFGHDAVSVQSAGPSVTYRSAAVAPSGDLVVTTSGGNSEAIPKQGDQTGWEKLLISGDKTAVGALALYSNCCTSYDIPLQLVVYFRGKAHTFLGQGMAIFQWHFADRGSRIAYGYTTVHFSCGTTYELRDLETERLIEKAFVPEPCGPIPDPPAVNPPDWVRALIAEKN